MITEIILIIFAIIYYLFSVFFVATLIEEPKDSIKKFIVHFIFIIFCSPIATPIMFGIELGIAIRENNED